MQPRNLNLMINHDEDLPSQSKYLDRIPPVFDE